MCEIARYAGRFFRAAWLAPKGRIDKIEQKLPSVPSWNVPWNYGRISPVGLTAFSLIHRKAVVVNDGRRELRNLPTISPLLVFLSPSLLSSFFRIKDTFIILSLDTIRKKLDKLSRAQRKTRVSQARIICR